MQNRNEFYKNIETVSPEVKNAIWKNIKTESRMISSRKFDLRSFSLGIVSTAIVIIIINIIPGWLIGSNDELTQLNEMYSKTINVLESSINDFENKYEVTDEFLDQKEKSFEEIIFIDNEIVSLSNDYMVDKAINKQKILQNLYSRKIDALEKLINTGVNTL